MTSTAVTELCGVNSNLQCKPGVGKAQANGFADAFMTASGNENEIAKSENLSKIHGTDVQRDRIISKQQKDVEKFNIKEKNIEEEMEKKASEIAAVIADKVNSVSEENISPEDVENIEGASLFTKDGRQQIVEELLGIADPIEMITDGEIYDMFVEMEGDVEVLMAELEDELGITDDEIENILKKLTENLEGENILPEIETEGLENTADFKAETDFEEITVTEETADTLKTENSLTGIDAKKEADDKSEDSKENNSSNNMTAMAQNFNPETVGDEFTVQTPESNTDEFISTQRIMEQITDYIKSKSSEDHKEVEMQLHPENLGNIHLSVTSKSGNVTANIIAQSESVRAALETQMIQLKESFEEHGITVDAVEITVRNERFDRNMDDSRDDANREAERKPAARRLNLSGLINGEEIEEEDEIAAEMMVANGNSLDYKA